MKIPDIELANISRFRGALMGIAMLIIIMFHVDLARWDTFYGLRRMGNLGVDMFLFLSGVGLWFSWVKTPSYKHFYFRRLIRIYPAWLIIACLYFIPRIPVHDTASLINLLGEILFNWNFWRYDELSFWYIPAIMALYLCAPPYMTLIRKHPVYRWFARGDDYVVHPRSMGDTHPPGRGAPGDFLEPRAHLLHRHQCRGIGATQGHYRRTGHLDAVDHVRHDICLMLLS